MGNETLTFNMRMGRTRMRMTNIYNEYHCLEYRQSLYNLTVHTAEICQCNGMYRKRQFFLHFQRRRSRYYTEVMNVRYGNTIFTVHVDVLATHISYVGLQHEK